MTQNQIRLQELTELKRSNLEKEDVARKQASASDLQAQAAIKQADVKEAELWKTKILGAEIPLQGLVYGLKDMSRPSWSIRKKTSHLNYGGR